jgi:hypothetical protein
MIETQAIGWQWRVLVEESLTLGTRANAQRAIRLSAKTIGTRATLGVAKRG